MKIAYITAKAPYGKGEAFIIEEMLMVSELGEDLLIIPRNPPLELFHKKGRQLINRIIWLPLFDKRFIIYFLKKLLSNLQLWRVIGDIFRYSRNPKILLKNVAILPKAVFLTKVMREKKIEHIHAHWGSTTATIAYVISKLKGIPWSFTLHRWDIREDNMLKEKVKSAKFCRIISEHGKNELLGVIGRDFEKKIEVINMGIEVPGEILELQKNKDFFTIITPANFVEKKGHKYLTEACEILINRGFRYFQCVFYGEGPLRREIESIIRGKDLTEYIKLPGAIPHEKLLHMYKNREVDIVVLPSINTSSGECEGIPVALMEAMAYSIPVISTNTGGIPELIGDGSGIMIEEKDSLALADAIERLIEDEAFREELGRKGRLKVMEDFYLDYIAKDLIKLFEEENSEL